MNSKRGSGFRDLGGLKSSVDAKLGDEVDEKPAVAPGQRPKMPRHAGTIAKSTCGSSKIMPRSHQVALWFGFGGWGVDLKPTHRKHTT